MLLRFCRLSDPLQDLRLLQSKLFYRRWLALFFCKRVFSLSAPCFFAHRGKAVDRIDQSAYVAFFHPESSPDHLLAEGNIIVHLFNIAQPFSQPIARVFIGFNDVSLSEVTAPGKGDIYLAPDLCIILHSVCVKLISLIAFVVYYQIGIFHVLQQENVVFPALLYHIIRPDGRLHFADMCLAQKIHAQSALADPAADGVRQLFI